MLRARRRPRRHDLLGWRTVRTRGREPRRARFRRSKRPPLPRTLPDFRQVARRRREPERPRASSRGRRSSSGGREGVAAGSLSRPTPRSSSTPAPRSPVPSHVKDSEDASSNAGPPGSQARSGSRLSMEPFRNACGSEIVSGRRPRTRASRTRWRSRDRPTRSKHEQRPTRR